MGKCYKIRKARIEDIEQIVSIWDQLMEFHFELDDLFQRCEDSEDAFTDFVRKNIDDNDKVVLVAESDGRIIGYCQGGLEKHPPALQKRDYGLIMDAAVDEKYRREGVGEAMVRYLFRWFKEKKLERVEVRFHVKNAISSSFWPKMGFEVYRKTAFMNI